MRNQFPNLIHKLTGITILHDWVSKGYLEENMKGYVFLDLRICCYDIFLFQFTSACHTRKSSQRHRRGSTQKDSLYPKMKTKLKEALGVLRRMELNLKNVDIFYNCVITVSIVGISPAECK